MFCFMGGIMKRENTIYLQWYPYRFKSGYMIEAPTEEALEKFYENVRASDPEHQSFVLTMDRQIVNSNINMKLIDEYVKESVLPFLYRK